MRGLQPMALAIRLPMLPCCVDGAVHFSTVSAAKDAHMPLISPLPMLRALCQTLSEAVSADFQTAGRRDEGRAACDAVQPCVELDVMAR